MPRTKHFDPSDTRLTSTDISVPSARTDLLLTQSLVDAASEIQEELLAEPGEASTSSSPEGEDGNGNGRRSLKQRLGLERERKVIELDVSSKQD